MLSLQKRRILFDLTQKFIEENSNKNNVYNETTSRMTRSKTEKKLDKPRFRLDIRKNAFTIRVKEHWNNLPIHIRECTSIHTFKSNLKTFLMTKLCTALKQ